MTPYTKITTAMVLAAGFGTRMRPLTDTMPKPLIPVAGTPLIDYTLDRFARAGVARAVVNVHYLADQIETHLADRAHPNILISDERGEILETGGGLIKAAPLLGDAPVFCTNTDAILEDGAGEPCARLLENWDDAKMDALLLLVPPEKASGYDGAGDFSLSTEGHVTWPGENRRGALVFTGLQIIHPRLFHTETLRKVSTRAFWEKAMAAGRLHGLRHDGFWMHVGDPGGLAAAEARLSGQS